MSITPPSTPISEHKFDGTLSIDSLKKSPTPKHTFEQNKKPGEILRRFSLSMTRIAAKDKNKSSPIPIYEVDGSDERDSPRTPESKTPTRTRSSPSESMIMKRQTIDVTPMSIPAALITPIYEPKTSEPITPGSTPPHASNIVLTDPPRERGLLLPPREYVTPHRESTPGRLATSSDVIEHILPKQKHTFSDFRKSLAAFPTKRSRKSKVEIAPEALESPRIVLKRNDTDESLEERVFYILFELGFLSFSLMLAVVVCYLLLSKR
ncbi:hypothetical protein PROFUN_11973 [Planoprotostelium fungivorum]|uniref:Uncharacterized protein n=1 Tax=Planoprotostelium fungivorum TaxID=1890364 RepID=A0A2P6N8V6_9EUKA|nr:hypothetical protein PROFUN_11973 [Planoprotostelium fungivorum]